MLDQIKECVEAVNLHLRGYGINIVFKGMGPPDEKQIAWITVHGPKNSLEAVSKLNISGIVQLMVRTKLVRADIKVAIFEYITTD